MKLTSTVSLIAALSLATAAFAQPAGMGGMAMKDKESKGCMGMMGMDMKGMDMKGMGPEQCMEMMKGMNMKGMSPENCSNMMKGMDMKGMSPEQCMDMMKGMNSKQTNQNAKLTAHVANDVVKSADIAQGKVTLSHEPVKSLEWPAMTMGFVVKEKGLFDKLKVGQKVKVEFVQDGNAYVVTAIK